MALRGGNAALVTTLLLVALPGPSLAVSAAAAAALGGALTPAGAERGGNAAGTIPAWTGGATTAPPGYSEGMPRADLFPGEQPLFAITAANAASYADHLPEGAMALFRKYADFRMDVYPTHRTAAAPRSVYDSIRLNAVRAHAAPAGIAFGVAGAAGGIPFPIPRQGAEIVWNHLLAFWGAAREVRVGIYVSPGDGSVQQTASYRETTDFPYYYPGARPDDFGGYYLKTRREQDAPASRAGEAYIAWQPIDAGLQHPVAWRYLPGEHRARKAPVLAYDTPDPDASGLQALDDYYLFFGSPDRYDFQILGKREMFVPYNNNRLYLRAPEAALGGLHETPGAVRYELHRVWVVQGTLAAGRHHVAPRRRLYMDEDTWLAVYAESWDEAGRLWKFGHGTMYVMPEIPAVITGTQFVYDLQLGGYCTDFVFAGQARQYAVTAPHDSDIFSAGALASESVR